MIRVERGPFLAQPGYFQKLDLGLKVEIPFAER
jgi:hypothetical protein